jgi:hypothetical protein
VTKVWWGENLGFLEGTQGESARGAPKTEASRQEEHPTNKTQRASDRGVVGRKLGVSRGNARRVSQRGAQNQGAKRSPTNKTQRPATEVQRGDLGFQRERKVRPEGHQQRSRRPTNKT